MAHGGVPYRDVAFEYPPGALVAVLLPALFTASHAAYYVTFALLMAVTGVGVLIASARLLARLGIVGRDATVRLVALGLAPAALGGVMLTRFDLFPIRRDPPRAARPRRTGVSVLAAGCSAVAIAIKVYPIVILPVAVAWVWRRSGRRRRARRARSRPWPCRSRLRCVRGASRRAASPTASGRNSRARSRSRASARACCSSLHQVAGTSLEWASGSGSQNLLRHRRVGARLAVGARRRGRAGRALDRSSRAGQRPTSVSCATRPRLSRAFVAFSKVLSPQYLLWLVFLVPLVAGVAGRRASARLAVAVRSDRASGSRVATGRSSRSSIRSARGSCCSADC